jgi:hypothetical protein
MGLVAEGGQKGPPQAIVFGHIFAYFCIIFAYFCLFMYNFTYFCLFLPLYASFLAARPVVHQSGFGGRKKRWTKKRPSAPGMEENSSAM